MQGNDIFPYSSHLDSLIVALRTMTVLDLGIRSVSWTAPDKAVFDELQAKISTNYLFLLEQGQMQLRAPGQYISLAARVRTSHHCHDWPLSSRYYLSPYGLVFPLIIPVDYQSVDSVLSIVAFPKVEQQQTSLIEQLDLRLRCTF